MAINNIWQVAVSAKWWNRLFFLLGFRVSLTRGSISRGLRIQYHDMEVMSHDIVLEFSSDLKICFLCHFQTKIQTARLVVSAVTWLSALYHMFQVSTPHWRIVRYNLNGTFLIMQEPWTVTFWLAPQCMLFRSTASRFRRIFVQVNSTTRVVALCILHR